MPEIAFDQVTKVYDDGTLAVDELDLVIGDAELLVIVGPSGCGKTTALRMLAGLEEISDGEIRIGEQVVNELTPKERDIAMVFQNYALYPHMSVEQNLAFGLRFRKLPKSEVKERVRRAAELLEIAGSSTRSRARSQGASGSVLPWGGRSCASRRRSSWTSRCRISTRSSACRCAQRSTTSSVACV